MSDPFSEETFTGALPGGCIDCGDGAKLVLLITGLCGQKCPYCPLSEHKDGKDVQYANERPVSSLDEVIEEALACSSLGTGITGGDPMRVKDRTLEYIRGLKAKLGPDHHIHLYTATAVEPAVLDELIEAGLDEIRFHPPPGIWANIFDRKGSPSYDQAISYAVGADISCGVEIPSLPDMAEDMTILAKRLAEAGVDFLNINELEMSTTNAEELHKMGYKASGASAAVDGSMEAAFKVVQELDVEMTIHGCSAGFKDSVQLRNRLLRRASNVRKPYEVMTDDGTLVFGIVVGGDVKDWAHTLTGAMKREGIEEELFAVRPDLNRLELAPWLLEDMLLDEDLKGFIIEEYPTFDRLEVERTPIE